MIYRITHRQNPRTKATPPPPPTPNGLKAKALNSTSEVCSSSLTRGPLTPELRELCCRRPFSPPPQMGRSGSKVGMASLGAKILRGSRAASLHKCALFPKSCHGAAPGEEVARGKFTHERGPGALQLPPTASVPFWLWALQDGLDFRRLGSKFELLCMSWHLAPHSKPVHVASRQ